jgi:hypothetical protein
MTVPPPEKLDTQIVDLQRWLPFQLLTSLLRLGGGWFANHALQRTRPSRSGCNPCVPRAGSLSLGRSPLRFAPGGTRELSSELLVSPPLRSGENQEFEQMPLRGTAQLARSVLKIDRRIRRYFYNQNCLISVMGTDTSSL